MIILGRECGLAIEMQQVTVQSLVPPQLTDAQSAEEFMQQLPQVLVHLAFFAAFAFFCCPIFNAGLAKVSGTSCRRVGLG